MTNRWMALLKNYIVQERVCGYSANRSRHAKHESTREDSTNSLPHLQQRLQFIRHEDLVRLASFRSTSFIEVSRDLWKWEHQASLDSRFDDRYKDQTLTIIWTSMKAAKYFVWLLPLLYCCFYYYPLFRCYEFRKMFLLSSECIKMISCLLEILQHG